MRMVRNFLGKLRGNSSDPGATARTDYPTGPTTQQAGSGGYSWQPPTWGRPPRGGKQPMITIREGRSLGIGILVMALLLWAGLQSNLGVGLWLLGFVPFLTGLSALVRHRRVAWFGSATTQGVLALLIGGVTLGIAGLGIAAVTTRPTPSRLAVATEPSASSPVATPMWSPTPIATPTLAPSSVPTPSQRPTPTPSPTPQPTQLPVMPATTTTATSPATSTTTTRASTTTTTTKPATTRAAAQSYSNCTALHVDYPHGVARVGGVDLVSGSPRKPQPAYRVDSALYAANSNLDRDGDGVACEVV